MNIRTFVAGLAFSGALLTTTTAIASDFEGFDATCKLENGRTLSVVADRGVVYYNYGKDISRPELSLTGDKEGVTAYWFYSMPASGSISYVRFNKGAYDYVVMVKDLATTEFSGVQVYKKGRKIAEHQCAGTGRRLQMNFSEGLFRVAEESASDADKFAWNE